jgi:hypothetical protein
LLIFRNTTKEQEIEIEKLKQVKDVQAKEMIDNLNKKLKDEEDRYQKLQQ